MSFRAWALAFVNIALFALLVARAWNGTATESLLAVAPRQWVEPKLEIAAPSTAAEPVSFQERPLFLASRQFYVPPLPPTIPVAPPRPDYKLVGTFIIPSKPTVAVIAQRASGASRKITLGDAEEGWLVRAIESRRVVLGYQDETFDIGNPAHGAGLAIVPLTARLPGNPSSPAVAGAPRVLGRGGIAAPLSSATSENARLYRPPGR